MAYNTSGTEKKIILYSPSMVQIFQKANLLAYNQASVLIYGESGVGKSFLAEYIQKSGGITGCSGRSGILQCLLWLSDPGSGNVKK